MLYSIWKDWDQAIVYIFFMVWRFLWVILDKIIDLITGYSLMYGSKAEREKAEQYENSAQVVKLWGRGNITFAIRHDLSNFGWIHQKYMDPREILKDDSITLMGVTKTHSFFCVSKDVDVYDSKRFPFVFMSHFYCAQKLVIVPNSTLIRLGSEIGDPDDRKVIMINMTVRCGSTLLCQIFSNVPGIRVQSEPWAQVHLQGLYVRKEISHAEYVPMLRSVFRIQCKKEHGHNKSTLVLKGDFFSGAQFPLLRKMFPKFRLIYNTRHVKPSLKSLEKVIDSFSKVMSVKHFVLSHLSFPLDSLTWWQRYNDYMQYKAKTSSFMDDFAFILAGNFQDFLDTKDIYEIIVIYEELLKDPHAVITDLFKKMDVDLEHVPVALEAMKHDSQGAVLGKPGLSHIVVSEDKWRKVDKLFEECGVPLKIDMPYEDFKNLVVN